MPSVPFGHVVSLVRVRDPNDYIARLVTGEPWRLVLDDMRACGLDPLPAVTAACVIINACLDDGRQSAGKRA